MEETIGQGVARIEGLEGPDSQFILMSILRS
jgi:hypothetical protein